MALRSHGEHMDKRHAAGLPAAAILCRHGLRFCDAAHSPIWRSPAPLWVRHPGESRTAPERHMDLRRTHEHLEERDEFDRSGCSLPRRVRLRSDELTSRALWRNTRRTVPGPLRFRRHLVLRPRDKRMAAGRPDLLAARAIRTRHGLRPGRHPPLRWMPAGPGPAMLHRYVVLRLPDTCLDEGVDESRTDVRSRKCFRLRSGWGHRSLWRFGTVGIRSPRRGRATCRLVLRAGCGYSPPPDRVLQRIDHRGCASVRCRVVLRRRCLEFGLEPGSRLLQIR